MLSQPVFFTRFTNITWINFHPSEIRANEMQRWGCTIRVATSPRDNKQQKDSGVGTSVIPCWLGMCTSFHVRQPGSLEWIASFSSVKLSCDSLKGAKCLNFYLSPDKDANFQFLLGNTDIVWQRGKPQPCSSTEKGIV